MLDQIKNQNVYMDLERNKKICFSHESLSKYSVLTASLYDQDFNILFDVKIVSEKPDHLLLRTS